MRALLGLLAASLLATFATGCTGILGCDSGPIVDTRPVTVQAAETTVTELSTCPGPTSSNEYEMVVTASGADGGASTLLTLTVARSAALQTSLPLTLATAGSDTEAVPDVQKAESPDGAVSLVYTANDDLEPTAVVAVIVTIEGMPATVGEALGATVEVHYVDGRVLEQTFSGANAGMNKCPAS